MVLERDDIDETIEEYRDTLEDVYIGRIVLLIVIALGLIYGGYAVLFATDVMEPTDEHTFDISYDSNGVTVEQTGGEIIEDNLNVEILYSDGFTQNTPISLDSNEPTDQITFAFDVSDVDQTTIYWEHDEDRVDIVSEPLPEEYQIYEPEITISDKEVEAGEELSITEDDYVLTTDSTIEQYDWAIGSLSFSGSSFTHTFEDAGEHNSQITIEDEFGNQVSDDFVVDVLQTDIIESVDIPDEVEVNQTIELGYETQHDIFSQLWTINGITHTSQNPTHIFDEEGMKEVKLTVKTEDAREEQIEKEVSVVQPSEDEGSDDEDEQSGVTGVELNVQSADDKEITFGLDKDPDLEIFEYEWRFGDTDFELTMDPETTHTYDSEGQYDVEVTATTNDGEMIEDILEIEIPYEGDTSDESDESDDEQSDEDEDDETEDDESTYDEVENADVRLTVNTRGEVAWVIEDIEGENPSNILQDDSMTSSNPTLYLKEGLRYEIDGIPKGETENNLKYFDFEIRELFGNPLLSQAVEGEFDQDEDVDWFDSENTVRFTITESLVEEGIDGYQSYEHSTQMDGDIIVVEDY